MRWKVSTIFEYENFGDIPRTEGGWLFGRRRKRRIRINLWIFCFFFAFQVRTLFVSGLPMDTKPRELYLLFRTYEVCFSVVLHIWSYIVCCAESNNILSTRLLINAVNLVMRLIAVAAKLYTYIPHFVFWTVIYDRLMGDRILYQIGGREH